MLRSTFDSTHAIQPLADGHSTPVSVKLTQMTGQFYLWIEMKGFLPKEWPTWFEGLEIKSCPEGQLQIKGILADQSALFGVLYQINNLGMDIKMLKCDQLPDNRSKGE